MIAALLCVSFLHASGASPPIVDADVREAVAQYKGLSYAEVVPLLGRALAKADLLDSDRDTALAYLARTYAIFKRGPEAEATFVELLKRKPDFAPSPKESPRIGEAFASARARLAEERRLASLPPPQPIVAPDLSAAAVAPPPAEEKSSHTALWIGAGVVVAATVAVLVIWHPWSRGDDGSPNQPPARDPPSIGQWQLP